MLKKLLIPSKTFRTSISLTIRTVVTLLTCQGVRWLVSVTLTIENMVQIQKVTIKLAIHFELQKHENHNLLRAITQERKKH